MVRFSFCVDVYSVLVFLDHVRLALSPSSCSCVNILAVPGGTEARMWSDREWFELAEIIM